MSFQTSLRARFGLRVACAVAVAIGALLPAGVRAQTSLPTPITFILRNGRADQVLVSITNRLKYGWYQIGMNPGQIDLIQQLIDGGYDVTTGDFLVRYHPASAPSQSYCEWRATASYHLKLRNWTCNIDPPISQGGAQCEGTAGKEWYGKCYFQFVVK